MTKKFLLDTNAFEYIVREDLKNRMTASVLAGNCEFYITYVQVQELNAIKESKPNKHSKLMDIMSLIRHPPFLTPTITGPDLTKRGFPASSVGETEITSDKDYEILKRCIKTIEGKELTNEADCLTIFMAIREGMDYIVTGDKDYPKFLEVFKEHRNTDLDIIDNSQLTDRL